MEVSRRADYAIRMLLELARRQASEPVSVRELADLQGVPYSFARGIQRALVAAGLVESRRGAQGGITLSRPPSDITLLDVVEATQGPVSVAVCASDPEWCSRMGGCTVHQVWCGANELLAGYLRSKDLASLVRKAG